MSLDKGDTYTDWARRPLSDTQVEYALNDVRYLPEVHRRLADELTREGAFPGCRRTSRGSRTPRRTIPCPRSSGAESSASRRSTGVSSLWRAK